MPCEMDGGLLTRRTFALGGAAALLAGGYAPRASANDLRLGEPAPAATLVTLDGERIATQSLRGSVVLLTFWATWCTPCREELPLLSRYATEHADGLRVLGFSLDTAQELAQVRSIARTLSFPNGLLERSQAPGYGRIWRLPVSFLLDRAGRLAVDGWREPAPAVTAAWLAAHVEPLLAAGNEGAGSR